MKRTVRGPGIFAWILLSILMPSAKAQAPAGNAPARRANPAGVRNQPQQQTPAADRNDSRRAGFRNPTGVGRYLEYTPPGNVHQHDLYSVPARPPTFSGGIGIPTVQDQITAQQLGALKANSIQQNINSYARPYYPFYGYGFGYGGGFYGGFYR